MALSYDNTFGEFPVAVKLQVTRGFMFYFKPLKSKEPITVTGRAG
jgi:hypothetical protein